MDTAIDALAPPMGLAIQIIEVCKVDPCPKALLHVAHRAFDLALLLRLLRPSHPPWPCDSEHKTRHRPRAAANTNLLISCCSRRCSLAFASAPTSPRNCYNGLRSPTS